MDMKGNATSDQPAATSPSFSTLLLPKRGGMEQRYRGGPGTQRTRSLISENKQLTVP